MSKDLDVSKVATGEQGRLGETPMKEATGEAAAAVPSLPRTAPFEPASRPEAPQPQGPRQEPPREPAALAQTPPKQMPGATVAAERNDRTGVFGQLVTDDADIAGLVAYSIYKQNKLDWLRAFEGATGRTPDEKELAAYIIGEGTPRRLATYRHLAEATLAGNGPDVAAAGPQAARTVPVARSLPAAAAAAPALIGAYVLIAALFVALLWLALHFTAAGH